MRQQPKRITIDIRTDVPNAEGIAYAMAKELHERLTTKPRYNVWTDVDVKDPNRLPSSFQHKVVARFTQISDGDDRP
jgi:hypothetical protein